MVKMNLILRNCDSEGRSHGGFQWNLTIGGVTEAPDWQPTEECGNGLHGFLWGEGDGSLATWPDALWLVCEIGDYIDLDGKVKFQRATTLFVGSLQEAAKYLYDKMLALGMVDKTAGDGSTQKAGGWSTQTAGNWSTQTAGYWSTQTAGDGSTQKAGDRCNHNIGNECYVTTGVGSVIIHRWYEGGWKVKTFVIDAEQAGKKFFYENGKQIVK